MNIVIHLKDPGKQTTCHNWDHFHLVLQLLYPMTDKVLIRGMVPDTAIQLDCSFHVDKREVLGSNLDSPLDSVPLRVSP